MNFKDKLTRAVASAGTPLMVGLDPDLRKIPDSLKTGKSEAEAVFSFCSAIIRLTEKKCIGYKLNLGFFEAIGAEGLGVFQRVVNQIPKEKIILADAKRGDIGNTAERYRDAFFETFGCDCITLNPLMGTDSLQPFLGRGDKAVFVLALTSNSGADDLLLQRLEDGRLVCESIAEQCANLDRNMPGTVGMVVGATRVHQLSSVLEKFPDALLLIPGIGAQGGDPEELLTVLKNHRGQAIPVISRAIIYAGTDENWESDVTRATENYAEIFSLLTGVVHD